ncbi:MAG: hypothetical protein II917_04105 [Synergistaceae bacterium]|nr:hypothetical protein [Synergistaceae bacterium]
MSILACFRINQVVGLAVALVVDTVKDHEIVVHVICAQVMPRESGSFTPAISEFVMLLSGLSGFLRMFTAS